MAVDRPDWDQYATYLEPMIELATRFKPKTILEIGLGQWAFSTGAWLSSSDAKVTTVDKGDWNDFGKVLTREYPGRFTFLKGMSQAVLPKIGEKFDLIYIDGDHEYEGVKSDILNCMKLVAPGGIIYLDDYGVEYSAIDVNEKGDPIDGHFGVKQAVDECFGKDWKRVYEDINFANGGVAYAKVEPR